MCGKKLWSIASFGIVVIVVGCCGPNLESSRMLQDEDPAVRIEAIIAAGQAYDRSAVPLLVDRLGDSDREVRLFAIMALEKITGTTMGYRHYGPEAQRQEALDRWRQWLKGGVLAMHAPPTEIGR